MAINDTLKRIDELQGKINAAGKLHKDILNKINYKFRLDWNYHSNAMEGNSLTRQETRTVMVGVAVIAGKPVKDIIEMQGHDSIISDMLKIGRGEIRISEKRIKDIHSSIVHEDDPGQKVKIGQWKTGNNYLLNYKGERFDFTPYQQVPEEMHALINWLNTEADKIVRREKEAIHPVILAFEFHYKYVSIHPFYDGNGRTGRILANLILISFGFPPLIIKLEEKENYGKYLADIQSYGGNHDLYYEFMAERLISSQELVLKAINGENIEELSDLEKGIELLKRSLEISPNEIKKSSEVLEELWKNSLSYLKSELIILYKKFSELFDTHSTYMSISHGNGGTSVSSDEQIQTVLADKNRVSTLTSMHFHFMFTQMRRHAHNTNIRVDVNFTSVSYQITNLRGNEIKKLYSETLTKEEINGFIFQTGKSFLEELNRINSKKDK